MEAKDVWAIGMSGAAIVVSLFALYFSHWYKPASAVLSFVSRLYGGAIINRQGEELEPATRELTYTLCNTGARALFVKSICLVRAADAMGYLRSHNPSIVIEEFSEAPFVLAVGEVKKVVITHDRNFVRKMNIDTQENDCELVSVEVISADGNRYQMIHNISGLGPTGPSLCDPLYNGVTLGSPLRSDGFV